MVRKIRNTEKFLRKCTICGKEEYVCETHANRKYCSKECLRKRPSVRDRICLNCNRKYHASRYDQKYCSQRCQLDYEYSHGKRDKFEIIKKARKTRMDRSLEKFRTNPTRKIGKRGYWLIYVPGRGWLKEHHYIWEKKNGPIPEGMCLHHIDFNPLNNLIGNLKIMEKKEHGKLHYAKRIIDVYGRFVPN